MTLWHARSVRLAGLAIGASLLACGLTDCQVLSTTVTSVTGTSDIYDPTQSDHGVPAEQVDFVVDGYQTGNIVCLIEVMDTDGNRVGSTIAIINPASSSGGTVEESVTVDITGNTFDGGPSNAQVHCGAPSQGSTG